MFIPNGSSNTLRPPDNGFSDFFSWNNDNPGDGFVDVFQGPCDRVSDVRPEGPQAIQRYIRQRQCLTGWEFLLVDRLGIIQDFFFSLGSTRLDFVAGVL